MWVWLGFDRRFRPAPQRRPLESRGEGHDERARDTRERVLAGQPAKGQYPKRCRMLESYLCMTFILKVERCGIMNRVAAPTGEERGV